jgi:hypothetical protein
MKEPLCKMTSNGDHQDRCGANNTNSLLIIRYQAIVFRYSRSKRLFRKNQLSEFGCTLGGVVIRFQVQLVRDAGHGIDNKLKVFAQIDS